MTPIELRKQLKRWMSDHGKSAVDVASITKMSPLSVKRFLDGDIKEPHKIAFEAYKELITPDQPVVTQ